MSVAKNTSTSAFQILRRKAPLNDNKRGNSPLERGRGVLECIYLVCITHPLPPLKRGISGCAQILRRDAPLDDRMSKNDKKRKTQ